jgi:aminoglycoside 3-N-acetyltransferase
VIQLTIKEIKDSFKQLKIKKGSSCLLHSSLINIGNIRGVNINNLPKVIIKVIFDLIGPNGTVSVLSPYYEYAELKKKFYINKKHCSKKVGSINQYVTKISKNRSIEPIFNISSIGKKSNFITKNVSATSFGEDSAWDRLYKLNTDMIFLGCNLSVCTFVRYIESKFGVPYLYNKHFSITIKNNKQIISKYSSSLLRYKHLKIEYKLKKFQDDLKNKKILRNNNNKKLNIMAVRMQPCFERGIKNLKKDFFYFLKKNPFKKNLLRKN